MFVQYYICLLISCKTGGKNGEPENNQSHLACLLLCVCLGLWEQEVEELKRKHKETSLLSHLEELLREKSAEATEKGERPDTCKDHHCWWKSCVFHNILSVVFNRKAMIAKHWLNNQKSTPKAIYHQLQNIFFNLQNVPVSTCLMFCSDQHFKSVVCWVDSYIFASCVEQFLSFK